MRSITEELRRRMSEEERSLSDAEVWEMSEREVLRSPLTEISGPEEKAAVAEGVFNALRSELDLLQPYGEDPLVSEIMVNGPDCIFVERQGRVERVPLRFENVEELEELLRRLAGRVHREINELNPIVSARLEDGSRINAVHRSVALNGPILNIRKFPENSVTMEMLVAWGSVSREAADFLRALVRGGYNIFVSGGTSSGKTTLLNALSGFIPRDQRVIVIEDAAELRIQGIENLVRMESKKANVQGKGRVSMAELIRSSLRMRPDRIIVGEVRGDEVLDMIQAMNTGHDGSLSTGHANSPEGMLTRLETLFLSAADFPAEAIRMQLAQALDVIVHMGRLPDKSRKVLEITEVLDCREGRIRLNPLFRYEKDKGLCATGAKLQNREKGERWGVF